MNKVNIVGILGQVPKLKKTKNDKSILNLSIGVKNTVDFEKIDWFAVVVFGKTAEYVDKYATKGDKLSIAGSLTKYDSETDGIKSSRYSILASEVEVLTFKKNNATEKTKVDDDDTDEITF